MYLGGSGGDAVETIDRTSTLLDTVEFTRRDLDDLYTRVTAHWVERVFPQITPAVREQASKIPVGKHTGVEQEQTYVIEDAAAVAAYGRRTRSVNCWPYSDIAGPRALANFLLEKYKRLNRIVNLDATVYGMAVQPGDVIAINLPSLPFPPEKGLVEEAAYQPGHYPEAPDRVGLKVRQFHWPGCSLACEGMCETTSCEVACEGHWEPTTCWVCETTFQTACQLVCVTAAQNLCAADGCQVALTAGCFTFCMPVSMNFCGWCETSCETTCENNPETLCNQTTCQVGCETTCETGCETYCESQCQTACESMCETQCQTECQGICETGVNETCCQAGCQTQCQEFCETGPCQTTCETGCEIDACQTMCETGCETECQTGCEVSCETACEGFCEPGYNEAV